MVERYTLTSLDEIPAMFGVAAPDGPPRFNIAPLQIAPICTADGLIAARWGLLRPWRGHGGKRGPHILHAPVGAIASPGSAGARSAPGGSAESIDATPVLRNAFKSQRCLILADGFFVWHRGGKKPQPLWLHPAADPARPGTRSRTVGLAGVAATHRDDHQPSFAILVGPAVAPIAPHAATMPLAIPAADHQTWLTGTRDRAAALVTAALAGPTGWRAEPVSTWVNSVDHDDARCVEPLGNPAQGELF
jgi:putative SOS response-associated peptidase YedK